MQCCLVLQKKPNDNRIVSIVISAYNFTRTQFIKIHRARLLQSDEILGKPLSDSYINQLLVIYKINQKSLIYEIDWFIFLTLLNGVIHAVKIKIWLIKVHFIFMKSKICFVMMVHNNTFVRYSVSGANLW